MGEIVVGGRVDKRRRVWRKSGGGALLLVLLVLLLLLVLWLLLLLLLLPLVLFVSLPLSLLWCHCVVAPELRVRAFVGPKAVGGEWKPPKKIHTVSTLYRG